MSEPFREQVERVIQMSRDHGETWDLSANDQAALKAVLLRMSELDGQLHAVEAEREALRQGLVKAPQHLAQLLSGEWVQVICVRDLPPPATPEGR